MGIRPQNPLRLFALLCAAAPACAQTLPAPTGFAATPQNGRVGLGWNPQPSATAYQVSRRLLGATPTPIATLTAPATPAFTDNQVTNGRTYEYSLLGLNGSGPGAASAVTVTPFSPPAAVDPLTVGNQVSNALSLSWQVPLSTYPVTLYQIFRYAVPVATVVSTPSPVPAALVLTASPTPYAQVASASFTDTAVGAPGASYFFYLALAQDSANPPNLSPAPAFSSAPALSKIQPPVAPQLSAFPGVTATPVVGASGYGVRLVWGGAAASEGVTGYQVWRDNHPVTILPVATVTPTFVFDDKAAPFSSSAGLPLDYAVEAMSAPGTALSNTVPVTFFGPKQSGAPKVTPDATQGAVTVTWPLGSGGSYGLAGYRIYKSLQGPPSTPLPTATGTLTPAPTVTPTPTPFATVALTPSASPTLAVLDGSVPNANGYSYWVEPYDQTSHAGNFAVPTPPVLALAPTPVLSVSAAGPTGNNQMTISWSGASAGFYGPIQGYVLYRLPALGFQTQTPTPVATVGADQSSVTDFIPNATPGTAYLYFVGAQDGQGNISPLSAVSDQVTAQAAQSAPSAPKLSPVSGDGVSLVYGWLGNPQADGVTQYTVYGPDWPTLTITPTPLATALATPSAYSFARPASPWQASLYYVLAKNAQGFSRPGTLAGISLPAYQVTAAMTPGSRQMRVVWNVTPTITPTPGFAAVDAYALYRSLTPGAGFTPIATVPAGTDGFTDAGLNPAAFYYYRITARADSGGQVLAESPLYPVMTPGPEGAGATWPNAVAGLSASGGVSATTLSWFPNAAAEQVDFYAILKNGDPTPVATFAGTPVPLATATLALQWQATETPGTASVYQVQAWNAQGPSDGGASVTVLSAANLTPTVGLTPPPGFSPTPGATPAVPQLVWISGLSYPGDVDGYQIYRSTDPGFAFEDLVASVSSPLSFVSDAPTTTQGFVNYYRVVPSHLGLSANPAVVGDSSLALWPNPPLPLLSAGTAAVSLAWPTPVGNVPVTGYQVFRSTDAGMTPTPMGGPFVSATQSLVDAQVTPLAAYFYSIRSFNGSGEGTASTPQGVIAVQAPALRVTPLAGRNQLVWAEFSPTVTPSPGVVTGFAIYRAIPTPGATPTYVPLSQVTGAGATTYLDTSVSDSINYLYQVAAVGSINSGQVFSPASNAVSQQVAPVPLVLTPIPGDQLVQLRWDYQGAPVTSVSYTLLRKLGTDSDPFQVVRAGITGVNYTDTGLLDKTFYVYEMETVDASSGATTLSAPVTALPAAPPVIDNLSVAVSQTGQGNYLIWNPANAGAGAFQPASMYPLGGYRVNISTDGGATYPNAVTLGTQPQAVTALSPKLSYLHALNLVGGVAHTYLIQAFDAPPDAPAESAHLSSYDLVTAFPVGASTALDLNAIRPNDGAPVVHIRVSVTRAGRVTLKVYNLAGTFIKELFDQNLTPGVYGAGDYPALQWDGRNMNGSLVASGVYLITTDMPGHQEIDKVALIK
ncbi:MAG TPA: hypothetical protein VMU88_05250 [bacterium]|nr:hypothetical protein [bacterium]